jgi:hypothetical protein
MESAAGADRMKWLEPLDVQAEGGSRKKHNSKDKCRDLDHR